MNFSNRNIPDKCLICGEKEELNVEPQIAEQIDHIKCKVCGEYI